MTREQSANKIIFAKSSLLGKRPTNQLQPGEIGLNTNSQEPGLFFGTTDGRVIKVGPTAVLPDAPTSTPERGETWLNTVDGTLNVGDAARSWRSIAAPYLGGGGTVVFVAPEFKYSTDSLKNDGQALPFQTIPRAILELTKIYLSRVIGGFPTSEESKKYTVLVAPSRVTTTNGPGASLENFNVDFSNKTTNEVTTPELQQFNSPTGGIIVPFGISVKGFDLRKSVISPTYVPTFQKPFFPTLSQGVDQPLSPIFHCGGNVYFEDLSVTDKIADRSVVSVENIQSNAAFWSERPHGHGFNDLVNVRYSSLVDQSTGTFTAGLYYVIPIDTYRFYLSTGSQTAENAEAYVAFSTLPLLPEGGFPKFIVTNELKSAHRLQLFSNASLSEIQDYYVKVQRAFPLFFGGKVVDSSQIVDVFDHVIVGPTNNYPNNQNSNTTRNSSFYSNQVNLRSDYGMCWGDFNGEENSGFSSVIANSCTAISLQNDPSVYEIYATLINPSTGVTEQKWWSLTEAVYLSTPLESRPASLADVTVESQLTLLNTTPITNIRYYYENLTTSEGKSIGIVNIEKDFRHFGFRVRNGAYGQFQSVYCIGYAIGVWSLNGGTCNLTNSTSNFGSVAFKSEGFLGINTIGGAKTNGKGFVFEGIQRPLALTKSQVESKSNKKILTLGGKITNIYIDPLDTSIQIIELNSDFSPCFLLPHSLKPGSALWVESETCTYRGFFATDGGPTVLTGLSEPSFAKLRLRSSDSTIPNDTTLLPVLGVPYIRRFLDPRNDFERSYSLCLKNTQPNAISPQVGSALRLNQTSQQLGSSSLVPNVQFDPGVLGGWGRVFTVDGVETNRLGSSPQFNYVINDASQDLVYYVAITATDLSRPWEQGPSFNLAQGSYTTFRNRNWYTAENNLWDCVYYGNASSFTTNSGPYSLAPIESCSPFVDTSVLERQDLVSRTYQGFYASDEYQDPQSYPDTHEEYSKGTYFRGSTEPYPTFSAQSVYDNDDSSESLGICLKSIAGGAETFTVTPLILVQAEQQADSTNRYAPSIVEFSVLSSTEIENPRQTVSVIQLSSSLGVEYFRVININSTTIRAIRLNYTNSFYQSTLPGGPDSPLDWPQQTKVTVCSTNPLPEQELYDPDWSNTKKAVYRFFQVMGYPASTMKPLLTPKYWGERLLATTSLSSTLPVNGYAQTTDKWPLEFNQPSTVIANTHTWSYAGYYNYSRGLPEFQSNDFTKKLSSDYQATTTWGGRLVVTGINDKGEVVQFGPQKQALTAKFYEALLPTSNTLNQQVYEEQEFVEYPSQVVVYSTDDISELFNGSLSTFDLLRSGLTIPPDQLQQDAMFVAVGAVMQRPGVDFNLVNNQIQFTSSPPAGASCNIRVVTSVDSLRTLEVLPLVFTENFDGIKTIFTAKTSLDPEKAKKLTGFKVTNNNTFVFLGGAEQIPVSDVDPEIPFSYSIERTSPTTIQFTFTGAPPEGSTIDIRAVCTGSYWSLRSIYPVHVYSLDPISGDFNGANLSFVLKYNNQIVNPSAVDQDNLIVSLGGAIQTPGVSYTVENSVLTFLSAGDAPQPGTSVNLRVIANAEFIACSNEGKYGTGFLKWGPGIVLTLANSAGIV